jgi:hypothetical protein
MSPRFQVYFLALLLMAIGLGLVAYKSQVLNLPITAGKYQTVWTIEAKIEFQPSAEAVKVSMALPKSQPHMEVLNEIFSSSGYGFTVQKNQGNERAVWSKREVKGPQTLYYKLDVYRRPQQVSRTELNLSTELNPPDWSGNRMAAVREAADSLITQSLKTSADTETFVTQLLKRFNDPDNIDSRLLLNGQHDKTHTQLILDLLAVAGRPAHILRGIYLEDDRSRLASSVLLEVYDGEEWLVFDPGTGDMGLPDNFLIWQQGDKSLLDVVGGSNSKIRFSILANNVPAREVALNQLNQQQAALMDYSIYSLPIEQQSIFKFILLVPVGALIVIFVRIVLGVRTAGTFMPVLLAIAFIQTSLLNGMAIFLLILGIGLWVRSYLSKLDLLLVSRIAAVVVIVVILMSAISIVSYRMGVEQALTVTFFPMIIIAWTIEHMSILWEDDGPGEVLVQTAGSLIVAILCYVAMTSHYIEHWMFNFPEFLLVILGGIIMLGHYTGYRLSELIRFRNMVSK